MKSVLIVEDDQVLADMYKDKFQFSNFNPVNAEDGEKGLMLALDRKPDIILLDLALPKLNGMEMMKKLRADSWGETVPIMVLTNLNVDGKVLEAIMEYSPVYCLIKANTTPEDVVKKANEVLSNSKKDKYE